MNDHVVVGNGCDYHSDCLTCPLPICREDHPQGIRGALRVARALRVQAMLHAGQPPKKIAERLNVSEKTIYSMLREITDLNTAQPDAVTYLRRVWRERSVDVSDDYGWSDLLAMHMRESDLQIVEGIVTDVCGEFNVTVKELQGKSRASWLIPPRHILMYRLRKEAELPFKVIGQMLKRDHSSIIHGVQRIAALTGQQA